MCVYYCRSNCLKIFLLYDTRKLCSKFGEDQSLNDVTILFTDAEQTNGRTDVYNYDFILCPMLCTAFDRQQFQTITRWASTYQRSLATHKMSTVGLWQFWRYQAMKDLLLTLTCNRPINQLSHCRAQTEIHWGKMFQWVGVMHFLKRQNHQSHNFLTQNGKVHCESFHKVV